MEPNILRHFVLDDTLEPCKKWMQDTLEIALEFIQNRQGHKLHSHLSLPAIEKLFSKVSLPEESEDLYQVLEDAKAQIIAHSVHVGSPSYVGHMTGQVPYFLLGIDLVTAALNQNVVKIETALSASFVEGQVISWLHRLVYGFSLSFYQKRIHKPQIALGNMTNGGTMGNLTALTCARIHSFPASEKKGIAQAIAQSEWKGAVILVSTRGHYSIKKVSSILGLGSESVIEIPVEPLSNKISIPHLISTIDELLAKKIKIVSLVGVAGSTETGSVDDLETMAEIAKKNGIWFHVDAAWGGALLLSRVGSTLFKGIEKADSVVLDGHKLFYLPLSLGSVVFKDPDKLDKLRHSARYIIRSGSVDLGRTSLEGSRRFDSFKLWFSLRVLGKKGYAQLLNHSLDLTRDFSKLVASHPFFEETSECQTNIFTYRFVPETFRLLLDHWHEIEQENSSHPLFLKIQTILNELNVDIQKTQRLAGKSFVSRTTLDSFLPGHETVVLRVVFMNPLTNLQHLSEMLEEQKQIGVQSFASRLPGFLKGLKRDQLTKLQSWLAL